MKKLFAGILTVIVICMQLIAVTADGSVAYVAPDGEGGTFSTVQEAVDSGASQIILKPGNYTEPVIIENKDGIIIRPETPGTVTFDGGTAIPFSSFKKVTDEAILDRIIEKKGKEAVVSVNLKDLGITELGNLHPNGFHPSGRDDAIEGQGFAPTLTYKDDLMPYGGYPNNDNFVYTSEIINEGDRSKPALGSLFEAQFKIADDRYKKWSEAKDIWALGFLSQDWADLTIPASVDSESGIITSYVADGYFVQSNRRIRFFNLLEELDIPGEWYLDRETGELYVIPPENIEASEELVFSAYDKNYITVKNSKNIKIYGIRFANNMAKGVIMDSCTDSEINNCEFADFGNTCVEITNSTRCGIRNSYIHDIGARGASVAGGDLATLTPGECYVENCHFETFTQYKKTYAPAIALGGCGNRVAHNEIHDAPHFAISYGGTNNQTFEYNEIYDVCKNTADCGAIYTGRRWTTRGNVIRYNYFHDLKAIETTAGGNVQAVYLDDMHSSTKVYSNVFYRCTNVALFGGGRNNEFTNNVIIDCSKPFTMDARGTWEQDTWQNMVQTMIKRLDDVPYKSDVWAESYPELVNILEDEPHLPKYNIISGNAEYHSAGYELDDLVKQYGTVENNVELKTTNSFADYRNQDFSLVEGSEIFEKLPGFEPVPFEKMGRYEFEPEVFELPEETNPDEIKVVLNGSAIKFDVKPQIINDRTMVPLRAIFEALGAAVEWDDASKTVTAVKGDITIKMTIGADSFTRNNESVALDSPATIVDSRTLVPVRAIAESFGSQVGWIAETKTVTITD